MFEFLFLATFNANNWILFNDVKMNHWHEQNNYLNNGKYFPLDCDQMRVAFSEKIQEKRKDEICCKCQMKKEKVVLCSFIVARSKYFYFVDLFVF